GTFFTADPKGKLIPGVLQRLAENSLAEREWFATEIAAMQKNIDYIKAIIAMQQDYASTAGVVEKLETSTLLEDALGMSEPNITSHQIEVVREFLPVPPITVEKDKVLQILINLIHNARDACDEAPASTNRKKIITLKIEPGESGEVRLIVRDNGVGIPPENLTRIFSHGFTTRSGGHGFALHTSILAARAMKGSLTAHSDGVGKGAEFVLVLPISPPASETTGTGLAEFPELNPHSSVDALTVR
ncbi:MAG TPA: HAMP domain-containing sensor histidine kinase, partial [Opitutus sp.]|nr:HAMP domain-containing sensor histidine kinase [Opitutus sp.]